MKPSPWKAPQTQPVIGHPRGARGDGSFSVTARICHLCAGGVSLCAGGLLAAIPAIVFGHIALAQINRLGGMEQGRGLAIAGLVMGYVYLALITLYLVFIFGLFALPSFQR